MEFIDEALEGRAAGAGVATMGTQGADDKSDLGSLESEQDAKIASKVSKDEESTESEDEDQKPPATNKGDVELDEDADEEDQPEVDHSGDEGDEDEEEEEEEEEDGGGHPTTTSTVAVAAAGATATAVSTAPVVAVMDGHAALAALVARNGIAVGGIAMVQQTNLRLFLVLTDGQAMASWSTVTTGRPLMPRAVTGIQVVSLMRADWLQNDLRVALVSRMTALAEMGFTMSATIANVAVRQRRAQDCLRRTFRPIAQVFTRWYQQGRQPGLPLPLCGYPVSLWRVARGNTTTHSSDGNVQFFDWGSEFQWTAFVFVGWHAWCRRHGATDAQSKYLAAVFVVQAVAQRFGVDSANLNWRPENHGFEGMPTLPHFH